MTKSNDQKKKKIQEKAKSTASFRVGLALKTQRGHFASFF